MNHATAIKQINEQLQNSNQSKPYHAVAHTALHLPSAVAGAMNVLNTI